MDEQIQLRIHGDATLPTLVYLPGLHGDWTLVSSFRAAVAGQVRFVEFTYPRTLSWSLADYAEAVESALLEHGIGAGWLLGESFSSQVAWQLLAKPVAETFRLRSDVVSVSTLAQPEGCGYRGGERRFQPRGLILAGGFVQHPAVWGVSLARRMCRGVSLTWLTRFLYFYANYAKFRHRQAPETMASIEEFIARRTELDRQAAVHRLALINQNDPRPIAQQTVLPVFALSGFWDPIVPWLWVHQWLDKNCPGCRGSRVLLRADHNVLGTAPKAAAEQIMRWITNSGSSGANDAATHAQLSSAANEIGVERVLRGVAK